MSALQEISKDFDPKELRDGAGRWARSSIGGVRDALAPIARKFDIRDDVKPNGKRVEGVPGKTDPRDNNLHVPYNRRNTFCYVYSAKFLKDNPQIKNAKLTHGYTTLGGSTINHSWVEMGDKVFEPNSGHTMTMKQFEKFFHPKREVQYTRDEFLMHKKESGHYGPWHEEVKKEWHFNPKQPRDPHTGRWVHLPGASLYKALKVTNVNGEYHVHEDSKNKPVKIFKTPQGATNFVNKQIQIDHQDTAAYRKVKAGHKKLLADREKHGQYLEQKQQAEQKAVATNRGFFDDAGNASIPAQRVKEKREVIARVTTSDMEHLPHPGTPSANQIAETKQWLRQNYSPQEAQYGGLLMRLLGKGITQDPKKRADLADRYNMKAGDLMKIEAELHDHLFPKTKAVSPRRRNLHGEANGLSPEQKATMEKHGALRGFPQASPRNKKSPTRLFKATKGTYKGKWVKVDANGRTTAVNETDANKFRAASKKYYAAQAKIQQAELDKKKNDVLQRVADRMDGELTQDQLDRKAELEFRHRVGRDWANSMELDGSDTYWHAFYWNDNSLLSWKDKDTTSIPLEIKLGPAASPRRPPTGRGHGPEEILAMPDVSQHEMRGRRPGPKQAVFGDDGFEPALPQNPTPAQEAAHKKLWGDWYEKQKLKDAKSAARARRAAQPKKQPAKPATSVRRNPKAIAAAKATEEAKTKRSVKVPKSALKNAGVKKPEKKPSATSPRRPTGKPAAGTPASPRRTPKPSTGVKKPAAPKKAPTSRAQRKVKREKLEFTAQTGLPLLPATKKPKAKYAPNKYPPAIVGRTRAATKADLSELEARGVTIPDIHKNIRVPVKKTSGFGSFDYMYDHHEKKSGNVVGNQRKYTLSHDQEGQRRKFARVAKIAEHMPTLDAIIRRDHTKSDVAGAVSLMRILAMRPSTEGGGETKVRIGTAPNGVDGIYEAVTTFGVTSMQRQHVTVNGNEVTISLTGKAAHEIKIVSDDPIVVGAIKGALSRHKNGKPTDRLFPVAPAETMKLIKSVMPDAKNKDMRTYVATALATQLVASMTTPTTVAEFKHRLLDVIETTANQLQHGPTQSRDSYISPSVFEGWAIASGVDYELFSNPRKGRTRQIKPIGWETK